MLRVEWTDQAIEKMEQISDYISLDSINAARNWIESVFNKEKLISVNPYIGREVPEYNNLQVREVFEGNYRVIYRVEVDKIRIITVINFKELLK
jgi:toxin ParE1/3/4